MNDRRLRTTDRAARGPLGAALDVRTRWRLRWRSSGWGSNEVHNRSRTPGIAKWRSWSNSSVRRDHFVATTSNPRRNNLIAPGPAVISGRNASVVTNGLGRQIVIVPAMWSARSILAMHNNNLHAAAVVDIRGPRHCNGQRHARLGGVDAVVISTAILWAHVADAASRWHPLLAEPDPVFVVPVPAAFEPLPAWTWGSREHVDALTWGALPRLLLRWSCVLDPWRSVTGRLPVAGGEGKQRREEQGLVEFHVHPIDSAWCERLGVPKDRRLCPKDHRAGSANSGKAGVSHAKEDIPQPTHGALSRDCGRAWLPIRP